MKKREENEIKIIDKKNLVLLKNPTELDIPSYSVLDGRNWTPVSYSARICFHVPGLDAYEYNKAGEVRHIGRNGAIKPIKLYKNRFVACKRRIYMPACPEIIVSDGERSFRFNSLPLARKILSLDVARLLSENISINGWMAQDGWPQPFIEGSDSSRAEDYVGQAQEDAEYLKSKGVYRV